jgi:virginiamycin A acetyltransferase
LDTDRKDTDSREVDIDSTARVYNRVDLKRTKLGKKSIIGDDSIVHDSNICDYVSINRRNYILRSSIGTFSYTGIGTMIRSSSIGSFCSISWNVSIGGGDHDFDHVTTSPLWRFAMMDGEIGHDSNKELQKRFDVQPDCKIGNDVWIATNAVVLRNVTIGDGAIIGAGAIVRKDVEPYTIVAGVPAKPIKKRFDDHIIEALQAIAWWDWPVDVIRENIDLIYQEKVDSEVIKRLQEIKGGLE